MERESGDTVILLQQFSCLVIRD